MTRLRAPPDGPGYTGPGSLLMDFALTEAQAEIHRQVLALARGFGWEYWREKDRKAEYPTEFVRAFADAGWLGLAIPEAYGGAGLGVTEAVLMLEAICASGAGLSGASPVHFAVFPPMPIIRHGSEGLRQRILPEIAAGRLSLAFGVTEPNAGTDTSRIQTTARRDGNGWIVTGRKVWTSNARHSAKMPPARPHDALRSRRPAQAGRAHALRRRPGPRGRGDPRDREARTGRRGLQRGDHRRAQGGGRGRGGRGGPWLRPPAATRSTRSVSSSPARRSGSGGSRSSGRPPTRASGSCSAGPSARTRRVAHPLALAWARLEGAWQLTLRAAWLFDRGEPCGAEANAAKVLAAEAGFEAADAALQTFGGFGYAKEFDVERLWREVRLYKIAPVSQQMALNYLAERVLGLPKSYYGAQMTEAAPAV